MPIPFRQLLELVLIIVSGVVAAVVFSPLAIWISKRTGLLDIPGIALPFGPGDQQPVWGIPVAIVGGRQIIPQPPAGECVDHNDKIPH